MSFDISNALKTLAPCLATMLLGPMAGTAVSALEGAFGLQAGSGVDGITKVMQAGQMTPEIAAAVRAADQKHAEIIQQQGLDLAKLNADHEAAMATVDASDRDSARRREETVKDSTPTALAWIIVSASVGAVLSLVMGIADVPKDAATASMVGTAIGYLISEAKQVLSYYFGSSASSKAKDLTIADIAKG